MGISAAMIFRRSIFTFLKKFQFFTATSAALAFPYAASVLVFQSFVPSSPFLDIIQARIRNLFEAAGFPSSSEFFTVFNLKLSQTIAVSFLASPFALSFLLLCKSSVIRALGNREFEKTTSMSSLVKVYTPLLLTQLCNSLVFLSANATCFSLLLIAFNLSGELGLSSARFELFLSIASALFCSVILANAFIICSLALVLSGAEKAGGFISILKACVLIKGRTATALSLAVPINFAMAAVEALFQYRVVRAYHRHHQAQSVALEGIFIAYMYAVLLVLDTIVVCFFFKSCCRRSLPSYTEIQEDHHYVLETKDC